MMLVYASMEDGYTMQ